MVELLNFVFKIKTALESESNRKLYTGFYDFPAGACMDASILLGLLLKRHGFGEFNIVSGRSTGIAFFTHAWLENENYLIDITAEQFSVCPIQSPVIEQIKKPRFYSTFDIKSINPVEKYNNIHDLGFYNVLNTINNKISYNSA